MPGPAALAATIHLRHPVTHESHTFAVGTVPPPWAAALITNPAAWDGAPPSPADVEDAQLQAAVDAQTVRLTDRIAELEGQVATLSDELRVAHEDAAKAQTLLDEFNPLGATLSTEPSTNDVTPPAAPLFMGGPDKPLDQWRKEELAKEIERLRLVGVDINVEAPGNKPELYDALRKYRET